MTLLGMSESQTPLFHSFLRQNATLLAPVACVLRPSRCYGLGSGRCCIDLLQVPGSRSFSSQTSLASDTTIPLHWSVGTTSPGWGFAEGRRASATHDLCRVQMPNRGSQPR